MQQDILPGRECGSCNVCCVSLTIDDPALQKVQGYRCKNARPDSSCAIYPSRPLTCREFNCGWRLLKWVREGLRPDRSGVLVRLHYEVSGGGEQARLGVIFTLWDKRALKAEGLAESVAAAVAADVPVYLQVPGPPGHTSGQARLNETLTHAVQTRDKPAVLEILRRARQQGLAGKYVPIQFKHGRTGSAAPVS